MDNIEEKFYMTFGIEKRCIRPKDCVRKGICRGAVACDFYTYPEITDRILLELICQNNGMSYEEFKNQTLRKTIQINGDNKYKIKAVQLLFKGGE